jgi:hypothetical protein
MKKAFLAYLNDIGIKDHSYSRTEAVYGTVRGLIDGEIMDIFASDYLELNGTRNYEDFFLFIPGKIIEVNQFMFIDRGKIFVNHVAGIRLPAVNLSRSAYEFQNALPESRLNVEAIYSDKIEIRLKASGKNCDYLAALLKKYFLR